jgi:transposase
MDDKTKKRTLAEEMKKTYGTVGGSRRIVINWINEPVKRLERKLVEYKFLRNFCKEEALVGVIVVVT